MRKRIYGLLLAALLTQTVKAQVTNKFIWTAKLPAQPIAIAADGARGSYVLLKGNTIVQVDPQGRERWKQTYADLPTIRRIATSPTGQLLLTGSFTGQFTVGDSTYSLAEEYDVSSFILAFDSNHNRQWVTYVISPEGLMGQPNSILTDATGGVLLFGQRANSRNPFFCRFDTEGRFLGARAYAGSPLTPPDAVAMATNSQGLALLGITERTRMSSQGVLTLVNDDSLYWRAYVGETLSSSPERSFDTVPLDLGVDRRDNTVVLSNYTLTDRTAGLRIENGQALLRYDGTGKNTWIKTGVTRADSAVATGLVADPGGAFVVFGGYEAYVPETNKYDAKDYISLAGYSPEGQIRWTTRLNSDNGNEKLVDVVRANNGSLLLLGSTTGTLSSLSVTGTQTEPAYFLTNLQPFELQATTAPLAVLCAGGQSTLKGNYVGHFEQAVTLQLSDAQGSFEKTQTLASIPVGVPGNLFSALNLDVNVPVASSLAAGTSYRLRAVSGLPEYLGTSVPVTVAQAPAIPAVQQVGDELVASTTGTSGLTYQWYANNRQPVAGATGDRFRPSQPGAYYAVAIANGCPSLASEALQYILLANEPTVVAEVNIYPNPTTDRLMVQWLGVSSGQLELMDLTGRPLRQQPRTGDVTEMNVRDLGMGTYLLSLQADGQPRVVKKVMVK